MNTLDHIFIDFIKNFKTVLLFIEEHFGDKDILVRKNAGLIPERNFGVKNSEIKGYVFHGSGCGFTLKNNVLDIEFNENNIGFTNWSFYSYSLNIKSDITKRETEQFLNGKIDKELSYNGKIFEIKV